MKTIQLNNKIVEFAKKNRLSNKIFRVVMMDITNVERKNPDVVKIKWSDSGDPITLTFAVTQQTYDLALMLKKYHNISGIPILAPEPVSVDVMFGKQEKKTAFVNIKEQEIVIIDIDSIDNMCKICTNLTKCLVLGSKCGLVNGGASETELTFKWRKNEHKQNHQ